MSDFITPLDVRRLRDTSADKRGTWKLLAALVYKSDLLGREVRVPAGFITDFASVPRLPVAYLLAGDEAHEEAVVHDWLYSTHVCDRATADAVFAEAMAVSGVPAWRRWVMWAGVRLGGGSHWDLDCTPQPPEIAASIKVVLPEAP